MLSFPAWSLRTHAELIVLATLKIEGTGYAYASFYVGWHFLVRVYVRTLLTCELHQNLYYQIAAAQQQQCASCCVC